MNPTDSGQMKRLWEAIAHSRDKLKPFRQQRLDAIKQYVGKNYGSNGADESVPVDFIELAVSIYVQQLVGGQPKAYVATNNQNLKVGAADLKVALDYTAERIRLEETLWRVVQDAMFSCGVVKMGLVQGAPGASYSWWNTAWQPFCDWVDLDDWVHDMTAKTWESIAFCGNRYCLPLEVVRNAEMFDQKIRMKLKPTKKSTTTESGDEVAATVGSGLGFEPDEYEDEVELWDIWLPREQLILTLPADDDKSLPLRVVKWDGPAEGPYSLLGFNVVPSNIMPLPPVAIWKDLHDLANSLYLKLGRQALRQKSVLPFRGGSEDDATRIRDSNDGDVFRVDGDVTKEIRYGGPDQVNLAFFLGLNELFNRHAGNLDTLGGLSPQADTLGQEEMLGANASQRVIFMRRKLAKFVDNIFTKLAHYLYADPLVDMPLVKKVEQTDIEIPFNWSPETREGDASLYQIAIEPYSLVYRTPQSQMQQLMNVLQTVVIPSLPLAQAQGIGLNFDALLKILSEQMNLPELIDILTFAEPLPQQQEGGMPSEESGAAEPGPAKPAVTTRNYVRRNIPGGSRSQKENALAQALLGSMPQPNESAAMMRSTG